MPESHTSHQKIIDLFNRSDEGRRHVHFFASMPDEVIAYIPGFWWNQQKLYALDLTDAPMPVTELEHFADVPIWRATRQAALFSVRGREILDSPDDFQDHWNRIMNSDLAYPIITYPREDGFILLDGYHRLHKALYLNERYMRVAMLSPDLLEDVLEHTGFLGELNAIARCEPNFIHTARSVAQELLSTDNSRIYPPWS